MKWHIDKTKLFLHNKLVYKQYFDHSSLYGNIRVQVYYLNGKHHNPNGPAYHRRSDCGKYELVSYWINGVRHRIDGPARMEFIYPNELYEEHWINGSMWHQYTQQ